MGVNPCKHNNGFMLSYNASTENYGYTCILCLVYKLPFNPDIFPEGVAYVDKSKEPGRILPPLSTGGKYWS